MSDKSFNFPTGSNMKYGITLFANSLPRSVGRERVNLSAEKEFTHGTQRWAHRERGESPTSFPCSLGSDGSMIYPLTGLRRAKLCESLTANPRQSHDRRALLCAIQGRSGISRQQVRPGIILAPMGTRPAPTSRSSWARCRGIRQPTDRPLAPRSPCGTPGRASPASRDGLHPFERRLRLCDPEVATANSPWELTAGSRSLEKPAVTKAVAPSCQ